MKRLSYVLLILGLLTLDMVSDLFLRPSHPGLAHDWDFTTSAGVGLALLALVTMRNAK
jgi:hypothetical protein